MLDFLTPAWVAALDEAARGHPALVEATAGITLVVEQRITGTPQGEVVFHVAVDRGRVSVATGPAEAATITFGQDYDTASAIAAGTESAQRAFMDGRLRVGGDLRTLLAHQEALGALDDVFAEVRARTDHPPVGTPPAGAGDC